MPRRRAYSYRLTVCERKVLHLLARGFSDEEIAAELDISYHTERSHVQSIFSKLEVHCRRAATKWYWAQAQG